MSTVSGDTYYSTDADRMYEITAVKVPMRNGDSFYLTNTMTLGDAIVASSVFLLLAFLVLKWLLNSVWRRS
ncbi:hypothetical protein PDUR_27910 (plasmid) [Paenibacillus durus]|uniref:Uncharacterized protein n=1 Tax=Paenibacillus durus TaxID=44251 RepID=A0A089HWU7_PAEDU|nr:hypothetical protein PDUR_27910 [Paenibacillus durus]